MYIKSNLTRSFLFLTMMFCIFTDINIFGVNSLPLVFFALYALVFCKKHSLIVVVVVSILFILVSLFSGVPLSLDFSVGSFVQFSVSMLVFLGAYNWLKVNFNEINIVSSLRVLLGLVTVLTVIQCLGIDAGLIEKFRQIISPNVYSNIEMLERDTLINLSGLIRPTLVAKESSFISIFVFLLLFSCLYLDEHRNKNAIFYAFVLIVSIYFNTSPLVIWLFMLFSGALLLSKSNYPIYQKVAIALALALVLWLSLPILFSRIEAATGVDVSFDNVIELASSGYIPVTSSLSVRLINPLVTVYDILSENIFFGAGFGNEDFIKRASSLGYYDINILLNNGFAAGLVYIGLFGMLTLVLLWSTLLKFKFHIFILLMFIVFFAAGGVTTMRLWTMFAFYLFVLKKKNVRES